MKKIIRRPRKVCTVNGLGKKKCFTIQARRRLNPEDDLSYKIDYIKKHLLNTKIQLNYHGRDSYIQILGTLELEYITDLDAKYVVTSNKDPGCFATFSLRESIVDIMGESKIIVIK